MQIWRLQLAKPKMVDGLVTEYIGIATDRRTWVYFKSIPSIRPKETSTTAPKTLKSLTRSIKLVDGIRGSYTKQVLIKNSLINSPLGKETYRAVMKGEPSFDL